jgi:hypothetical protein
MHSFDLLYSRCRFACLLDPSLFTLGCGVVQYYDVNLPAFADDCTLLLSHNWEISCRYEIILFTRCSIKCSSLDRCTPTHTADEFENYLSIACIQQGDYSTKFAIQLLNAPCTDAGYDPDPLMQPKKFVMMKILSTIIISSPVDRKLTGLGMKCGPIM